MMVPISTVALLDLLDVPPTTGNARRLALTMRSMGWVGLKSRRLAPGGIRGTTIRGWSRPDDRHYSESGSCASSSIAAAKLESDKPSNLTAFGNGIDFSSSLTVTRASSSRSATGAGIDWQRDMISKSENFTLSVTVLPRLPVFSQCRQTLSMSG
jgi:hypothetical protein